jgi:hypothetical protein
MRLVSQLLCLRSETGSIPVRGADTSELRERRGFQIRGTRFDSWRACHGDGRRRLLTCLASMSTGSVTRRLHRVPMQHEGRAPRWYRGGPSSILGVGSTRVWCSTASTPAFQAGRDGSNPSTRTSRKSWGSAQGRHVPQSKCYGSTSRCQREGVGSTPADCTNLTRSTGCDDRCKRSVGRIIPDARLQALAEDSAVPSKRKRAGSIPAESAQVSLC